MKMTFTATRHHTRTCRNDETVPAPELTNCIIFAKNNTSLFKKIAGTAIARALNALLGFAIVVVAARTFGAEGYGTIVLVILGITFIQLINNFIGGPALVYLVPRHDVFNLFILSYVWALVVSVIGANILALSGMIPLEYRRETIMLSLLSNWASINMMILIGKEKIRFYNIISVLQTALVFMSIFVFTRLLGREHIDYYIYALFIAYLSTFLMSLTAIRHYVVFSDLNQIGRPVKHILHYGGLMQLASIIQFFNYRLSYYLLQIYFDKAELGKFAVGVQLAEGMWLISKSVALVQYSRISNEKGNEDYAKQVSVLFLKFTLLITVLMLLVLVAFPNSLFAYIFGAEFIHIKPVIIAMSPGILALSASHIFSHYFSGTGKPQHNTISSASGFVIVLIAGLVLIPRIGPIFAAVATSLSYLTIFVYQLFWFMKISNTGSKEMVINRADMLKIKSEIQSFWRK